MIGSIMLDIFNLEVAIFRSEADRIECLRGEGCDNLSEHNPASISSAHLDMTRDGAPRLSMVIKPKATRATWVHECVHIADFVIDLLNLPTGVENTEIRAYMVGHLFAGLSEIIGSRRGRK